jgi:N,N'-diacetyllegionaminate synthase
MIKKPIFIAEIGMNADGNFDLNHELIRCAADAGADIAKFQIGWRGEADDINFIDYDRLKKLISWCEYFNIEFMASIITKDALELSKKFDIRRYKIASRTLIDDLPLAQSIIDLRKPTFVSLGMWDDAKLPFEAKNISYLYCKSKYPTHIDDLRNFPEFFDNSIVGYSDHFMGIEACLVALARGATVIEKHFTLNKTSKVIRDHALSATPEEFANLVKIGKNISRFVESVGAKPRGSID